MNVGDLRRALAGLPDDMPIVTNDSERGWDDDVGVYLAAAHVEHHTYGNVIGEGPARNSVEWPWEQTDCRVLLISEFGEYDDGIVDLSPRHDRPNVVDADPDTRQLRLSVGDDQGEPTAHDRDQPHPSGDDDGDGVIGQVKSTMHR